MTTYIHKDEKTEVEVTIDNIKEIIKEDGFITQTIYREKPLLTIYVKLHTEYGILTAQVTGEGKLNFE